MHGISFPLNKIPPESDPASEASVFSQGELFSNPDPRYFDEGHVERDD